MQRPLGLHLFFALLVCRVEAWRALEGGLVCMIFRYEHKAVMQVHSRGQDFCMACKQATGCLYTGLLTGSTRPVDWWH